MRTNHSYHVTRLFAVCLWACLGAASGLVECVVFFFGTGRGVRLAKNMGHLYFIFYTIYGGRSGWRLGEGLAKSAAAITFERMEATCNTCDGFEGHLLIFDC